jgi:16S rRNA (uracil1498-N3)-methyltransferase
MYFYLPNLNQKEFSHDFAKHFLTMRVKKDDLVTVTDLKGSKAEIRIEKIDIKDKIINYSIIDKIVEPKPKIEKILIQAQIDKFYLEKLCEVAPLADISKIILFRNDRTQNQSPNFERLDRILIRCCEQGEKCYKPKLYLLKTDEELTEVLTSLKPIVLTKNGKLNINALDKTKISIIVGPDGGWTKEELKKFTSLKLKTASLGKTNYPVWLAGYTFFV